MRNSTIAAVGVVVWLIWMIGGAWVADLLYEEAGWVVTLFTVIVVVGLGIGVPLYLVSRFTDDDTLR